MQQQLGKKHEKKQKEVAAKMFASLEAAGGNRHHRQVTISLADPFVQLVSYAHDPTIDEYLSSREFRNQVARQSVDWGVNVNQLNWNDMQIHPVVSRQTKMSAWANYARRFSLIPQIILPVRESPSSRVNLVSQLKTLQVQNAALSLAHVQPQPQPQSQPAAEAVDFRKELQAMKEMMEATFNGEIAKLKQRNIEQDGEIAKLKQRNIEQDGEIAKLKQRNIEQDGEIAQLKQTVHNLMEAHGMSQDVVLRRMLEAARNRFLAKHERRDNESKKDFLDRVLSEADAYTQWVLAEYQVVSRRIHGDLPPKHAAIDALNHENATDPQYWRLFRELYGAQAPQASPQIP